MPAALGEVHHDKVVHCAVRRPERLAQVRDKVYFGGPLEFGSVWFLFRTAAPPEHVIQA
jgi:hypothetical protein